MEKFKFGEISSLIAEGSSFGTRYFISWIRIRIWNADKDLVSGGKKYADPCGPGSVTLLIIC
jgi:hypothetical protein